MSHWRAPDDRPQAVFTNIWPAVAFSTLLWVIIIASVCLWVGGTGDKLASDRAAIGRAVR